MSVKPVSAIFCLGIAMLILAGCSNHISSSPPAPGTVTGVVTAPNPAEFASARSAGFLARFAALILPSVYADIIGIAPVTGATVELDRLDSAGNVLQTLAQTTTDSTGSYTFTNVPAITDSSLQVRVVGQSDTMRAIVTGTTANISPVSEVVVSDVVASLGASVPLQNFTVGEVAALVSALQGMDRDITGMTFSQAVTAIQGDASGPLFSQLLADFSTAGSSTVLRGGYYAMAETRSVLRDPHLLPIAGAPSGIELDGGYGPLVFPANDDRPSPGLEFYGAYLHDLTSVSDLASSPSTNDLPFGRSLGNLLHVSASAGQLVVADATDSGITAAGVGATVAGIGALTPDASLMIYPLDASARVNGQPSWFGMGLRLATRWLQPSGALPLDLTLLDGTGAGTVYHQVSLKEDMLGQGSGSNAVSLTTRVGSITFNSTAAPGTFDRTYGTFAENVQTNSLSMDLGAYTVSEATGSDVPNGLYYVFPNGGQVQFADATGAATLGLGSTIEDGVRNGEVVTSQQFSGGFDSPVAHVQRSYSVAIHQAIGLANVNLSGTYNLVEYGGYLSTTASPPDGTIESGIRYGTITVDGSGNVTGGNLYGKRASMDLAAAAATVSPSSSGQSGSFTTATATAAGQTFSLAVGGVTLFTFTSAASGDTVTAADIDAGISTNASALSGAGITFTGTVAGGDLVFTKTDGSAFDIVVTNEFNSTSGAAGGFSGTDFAAGTNTVSNGTAAVSNTSGSSGAFTGVTLAANQRYTLTVGGVSVYDSAGASSTSAADIDSALTAATSNLSAAGISFTGTAAGGDLTFSRADGAAFDIVIVNGSGLGGFANFPTGTTTVNNGSAVVVTTSGSSGAFTSVTLAPAQRYTLTVGGVSVYDSAGASSTSAADIDSALTAATSNLSAAGISFTGTAVGGDLAFSRADGAAFDIVIVNGSGLGGFANFPAGTTTVNNGSTVVVTTSGSSGAFTSVTLAPAQRYTLTVGGVSVYDSAGASSTSAADIDNALTAATSNLSAAGISFTGTAAGGDLTFSRADGAAFDIVVVNDSGAGGFAGFPTGTTTVSNGTAAAQNASGTSGTFTDVALAAGQNYTLTVGGVLIYDSAGASSTLAADIDNALAVASGSLSSAGISFTGTAAGGDLIFSRADGAAFDIVIVNDSGAGGFANFPTGTTTVNNGSLAVPSTSGPSGAFSTVTLAPAQHYTLAVGGVSVYGSVGPSTVSAANIDSALTAATSNLSAAGISFTGTAAGGDLVFSRADGSAFNIVIVNDSGAGGFANFATGTTPVNNGSPAVPNTSGPSGAFTAVTLAPAQHYTLTVGGVAVYGAVGPSSVSAANIDSALASATANLSAAGISFTGTAAAGDLVFSKADGSAFNIVIVNDSGAGGFANFATGTTTVNNGSPAVPSNSGPSGTFTAVTLAPAQRYTLAVGGVPVYDSAGASSTSAADIDNALTAATSNLSAAGISFTGTAGGGDLTFSRADGTAFNIVITNDSGAGGFANFLTGTTTVNNGSAAVPSLSSPSGTFTTAVAGASGQRFTLTVGGVVVFDFTSAAAGDQVTAADIDNGIAASAASLTAAGIGYSGTVAGGNLQFSKADGTSFTIAVSNNFNSVTTTSGGFAGTDFAAGTNTINNGSVPTPSLSSAVGQEIIASGGSYNVSTDGTLTLNLTIGGETLSGSGAVTQEGDFAAVAITSDDTVRKGRGLLFLVRQP